jgi:hypothetical protein
VRDATSSPTSKGGREAALGRCDGLAMSTHQPPSSDNAIELVLADGRVMTVRPTNATDVRRMLTLYDALSDRDRHRRFFGSFRPRADWCRDWASIGERGGYGLIAIVRDHDGSEVVAGEAGYAMRDDGDGELAVTIAAPWRGWLGPYLLDVLLERAAESGVANLRADVLLDNGPMLSLLRRRDPVAVGHDRGVVNLSVGTGGRAPTWPPNDDRPRVLVEIAGRRWSGADRAVDAGLTVAMCAGPAGRRHNECPVLTGGRCPLADGADAIVMMLDPDDERSRRLAEAHQEHVPGRPVLVRRSAIASKVDGCIDVGTDSGDVVEQLLALIGSPRTGDVAGTDGG